MPPPVGAAPLPPRADTAVAAVATDRLPHVSIAEDGVRTRDLLDQSTIGAVEIARPPLEDLPYRDLVRALLGRQGFKIDFNRLDPAAALDLVSDQLLGHGAYVRERALLAQDIAALTAFAEQLTGGRATVSLRTVFMPGDSVWHLDRLIERRAYRLLWPIGRVAGMKLTPPSNIDPHIYRAFMRREFPLLGALDTRVLRTGHGAERLWAHRPAQLAAMETGAFPFLVDPAAEYAVTPGAASIHRAETPAQRGSWHRSSWANRHMPGLQIVITAVSDA